METKQLHLNEIGNQIVYWNEDGEGFTQDQMDTAEARAEAAAEDYEPEQS